MYDVNTDGAGHLMNFEAGPYIKFGGLQCLKLFFERKYTLILNGGTLNLGM